MNKRFALLLRVGLFVILIGGTVFQPQYPVFATAVLTIEPITWNVIGLDSNNVNVGPNDFPVGARVCNESTAGETLTGVSSSFTLTGTNPYINYRPGTNTSYSGYTLTAGACIDFYYEVEVTRTAAAYNTTETYVITASSNETGTVTTPTPRELYVEHLVSQNRNAVTDVLLDGVSIPAGGTMTLVVGQTYTITLVGFTATQGYEQLESFINIPNTIFQINSVSTSYSAPTPHSNPRLYADACTWQNDPNSPNYRSCLGVGKEGGDVTVTYQVTILQAPSAPLVNPQPLSTLIYDFSGSSYHYNSDFGVSTRYAFILDPSTLTISKNFNPDPTNAGGISTLTFTLTNPNPVSVSGLNFTDTLPTTPGAMTIANPTNASTSGCGSPTFAPVAGAGSLSFSNGTIAANSFCTIKVNVTVPVVGTYTNTSNHLFINSLDTGNFATDPLTVNNTPAPPSPVCGLTMAQWTFAGFTSNPPPFPAANTQASNVATAAISVGNGLTAESDVTASGGNPQPGIRTYGWQNAGPINTATSAFIQFAIDTSQYTQVNLQFDAQRKANGPSSDELYYSTNGTTWTLKSTFTSTTSWASYGAYDFTGQTSTTGITYFRIYGYGANATSSGNDFNLDNVTFTGCATPTPPTITKAFSPNPIAVNGTSTLTFTLSNSNSIALTGVTFTDTLPTGLQVASTPSATTTCGGTPTWAPTAGATSLTFGSPTGASIPANSSCTVSVNVTGTASGSYQNISGFISSTNGGTNTGSTGSATASLTVLQPPVISKLFAPNPILAGGISTLTFTISNPNLNNPLTGVAFSDTYPGGVTNTNPLSTSNSCGGALTVAAGGGNISLSGGGIAAGGSCTVTTTVTVLTVGTFANTSLAVSSTNGGTGNTASDTLTVKAPNPAVSILKQVSTSVTGPWSTFLSVSAGTNIYYQFTVQNDGDVPLSSVTVNDPQISTASCIWRNGDGTILTAPITLPVASAANNQHYMTCVVGPVSAVTGSHPNTATATGTYSPTNYTDTSTASYATPGVALVKTVTETSFTAESDLLHYSYLVTNSGFVPLLGPVTVTDDKVTVTCPAVNTVGDFDDWLDPADYPKVGIPAESITCTATYTVSADDAAAGFVTNTASATINSVTSNTDSQTVNQIRPDLTVAKTNNVSGIVLQNGTFDWTITVTNSGTTDAIFADGQAILSDPLPTNASYGPIIMGGSVFSQLDCAISSGTLTCTANGGTVTLPAGASFSVTFAVTPTAAGSFVNTATVDPGLVITEGNETNNSSTDTVTVVAPPTIVKSFGTNPIAVNGTSIITFVITNPSANVVSLDGVGFTDTYPAGLQNAAVPNASTTCTGLVLINAPPNGGFISLSGASIPVNSSCTVTVTVTAATTGTKTNSVTVTSTNGGIGNTATANLGVIGASKTVVSTSEVSTTGNNVAIGEIVRYHLVIDLPEGTTANLQIIDRIVTNMAYLNDGSTRIAFVCNSGTSCAASSTAAIGTNPVISGNSSSVTPTFVLPAANITGDTGNPYSDGVDPTFSLGDVTNNDSDADSEYVVIEFNSLVRNVLANQDTNTRGNTFTVNVNGSALTSTTSTTSDRVTIVEPAVTAIAKSVIAAPTDAGDTITYQLQFTNTGTASAFDISVTDTLNSVLTSPVTVTGSTTGGDCGSTASIVTGSYSAPNATATVTCLAPGGTATINITATVSNTAPAGYTFSNFASLTYTSLPGTNGTPSGSGGNSTGSSNPGAAGTANGERTGAGGTNDYFATSNTVSTTLANPSLTKIINPAGTTFAIGATIPYEITITVPEGLTGNPTANLVDTIPTGLSYVNGSLSVTPQAGVMIGAAGPYTDANASFFNLSGQTLTLTFGSFTSAAAGSATSRTITVAFLVQVDNVVGNQSGTTFTNSADFVRTNPNGVGTVTLTATAPVVSVIEPALSVSKAASTATPAFNSTLTYTLTVSHTGASNSPAYDTVITDTLPSGLTNLTNVNVTSTAPVSCATGVVDNSTASALNVTIGTIPLGCAVTITYDVTVSGALGSTQTNSVNAVWTSQAGSVTGERTGADGIGGALNDYAASTSQAVTVGGPDLSVAKTDGSFSYTPGTSITYTITVSNVGNSTADGTVTDTFPVSLTSVSWTCVGTNNATCTPTSGAGDINNNVSIPAGESVTYTINATVLSSATGNLINTASVALIGGTDPTPGNNSSTDLDEPNPQADLTITKTDGSATYVPGGGVTYTVTVTNIGPSDVTGATVVDTFPAAITNATWTCAGSGGGTCTANGTGDINDSVDIPAGGSVTYTVTATIGASATGNLTNTASVTPPAGTNDPDLTNNTATDTDTANPIADLSVTKTVNNTTPLVGTTITFTITVTNSGPSTATNVAVSDVLPAGLTFVSSTMSQGTYNSGPGLWTVGTLNSGAGATLDIVATATTTGAQPNTAQVSASDQPDPDSTNNQASVTVTPQGTPALTILKTLDSNADEDNSNTVSLNDTLTYSVTVTNTGNTTLTNVVVSDTLITPNTITCTTLAPNATCILTGTHVVTQTDVDNGQINNTGSVIDDDVCNPTACDDPNIVTVSQTPAINVVKSSTATSITSVGQVVPYTFTVTNVGNVTLTGIAVSDPNCTTAPAYQSGDTNTNSSLDLTETWTYTCNRTVTQAEVNAGGNLSNTVTADSSESGSDMDTLNIPVTQTPGLILTKTANPTGVTNAGDVITYTFSVQNTGNVTLTNITLSDTLLSTLNCTPITSLAPNATQSFTCTGNSYTITQTDLNNNGGGDGDIDNTATATGTAPSGGTTSDTDSQAVTLPAPAPDLSLAKTNGATSVTAGGTTTYTLTVTNSGNAATTGTIAIVDVLATGLNIANGPVPVGGANATDWTCNAATNVITCTSSTAIAGSNGTSVFDFTVNVDVNASGTLINRAQVGGGGDPTNPNPPTSITAGQCTATNTPNEGCATDSDPVSGAQVADPALSKAGNPTQATIGETVTFTLTVTNAGNIPAPNVVVNDPLPAMFDVVTVTSVYQAGGNAGTISVSPAPAPYTVTVNLGTLNVTDVVIITITTTASSLGNPPINNSANVSTSALSDIAANNSDSVTITLRSSGSGSNRPALLPATGFVPDVETKLPARSQDMMYAATDLLLEIPSLGVKLPVVGVPKKSGTWDVSWLSKQAGWLEGSAFPSWSGNSVLTSHVYASNGLPGPFVNLNKLKYGDQIIVHAYGQKYIFEVQTNQVVAPNDTSAFKHEEKSWLTLITCKEYDEKTNSYRKRVVVRAVLVKVVWDK